MQLIAIMVIAGVHFLLRSPLMRYLPRGVDAHFHLLATSRFRSWHPPNALGKFLVGDNYTHPPLLHFVLSFFPERLRPQALFTVGMASDYGIAILTYFLSLQYMSEPYALLAAVVYSITPASYLQSISESARPLGALWYNLSIVLLFSRGLLEMTLAAVLIAFTLLTHKMATQTLLFTCVLLSPFLYIANKMFPLILLLGFVLALLFTKGGYLRILEDHVRYIRFHVKHGSWDKGKKQPGNPKWLAKLQPYFYIPLIGLFLYSVNLLADVSLILVWYISLLVVFFFWLWGDGYRYLAYSALPTAVLSAFVMYTGGNTWLIIPGLIVAAGVIGKRIAVSQRHTVLPDFSKINIPQDSVTLTVPSSIAYVSARHLNGKIVCGGGNAEALVFELDTLPKLMSTAPDKLLRIYPITHVLLGPKQRDFINPIENEFEYTLETNHYLLYRRKLPVDAST
jgi:hypothetical protein